MCRAAQCAELNDYTRITLCKAAVMAHNIEWFRSQYKPGRNLSSGCMGKCAWIFDASWKYKLCVLSAGSLELWCFNVCSRQWPQFHEPRMGFRKANANWERTSTACTCAWVCLSWLLGSVTIQFLCGTNENGKKTSCSWNLDHNTTNEMGPFACVESQWLAETLSEKEKCYLRRLGLGQLRMRVATENVWGVLRPCFCWLSGLCESSLPWSLA